MNLGHDLDQFLVGWLHRRVEDDGDLHFFDDEGEMLILKSQKAWLKARHYLNASSDEAFAAALEDCQEDGCALRQLAGNLAANPEIILAALAQNIGAIAFVPPENLEDLGCMQVLYTKFPNLQLHQANLLTSTLAREISAGATLFSVTEADYALSRPQKVVTVDSISAPDHDGVCTLTFFIGLGVEGPEEEVDFNLGDVNWYTTRALREHLAQNVFQTDIDDFQITLG